VAANCSSGAGPLLRTVSAKHQAMRTYGCRRSLFTALVVAAVVALLFLGWLLKDRPQPIPVTAWCEESETEGRRVFALVVANTDRHSVVLDGAFISDVDGIRSLMLTDTRRCGN
jgi:hypothetical protein